MSKMHPFVRLADKGDYAYGLYTEGGLRPDRILGSAPSRTEAWEALLDNLQRRYRRTMILAALSAGAGLMLLLGGSHSSDQPLPQRAEICTELSFEQQGGTTVPRGYTEACQTRATGDAQ